MIIQLELTENEADELEKLAADWLAATVNTSEHCDECGEWRGSFLDTPRVYNSAESLSRKSQDAITFPIKR